MYRIPTSWLTACLLLLSIALVPHAQAQEPAPGLIVTYVEAPPAKAAALATDLRAYAAQTQSGAEKPTVILLKEIGRPSRMAILEQWPNVSSPAVADAATALAARVRPDALAPLDRRLNHPITTLLSRAPSTAFHVLMHLDVSSGPSAEALLKAQRDAVMAAPGALAYEVAVQDKHTNHFAVHEVWANRKAYDAYMATPPAAGLRRGLAPLLGSPLDERFYTTAVH